MRGRLALVAVAVLAVAIVPARDAPAQTGCPPRGTERLIGAKDEVVVRVSRRTGRVTACHRTTGRRRTLVCGRAEPDCSDWGGLDAVAGRYLVFTATSYDGTGSETRTVGFDTRTGFDARLVISQSPSGFADAEGVILGPGGTVAYSIRQSSVEPAVHVCPLRACEQSPPIEASFSLDPKSLRRVGDTVCWTTWAMQRCHPFE